MCSVKIQYYNIIPIYIIIITTPVTRLITSDIIYSFMHLTSTDICVFAIYGNYPKFAIVIMYYYNTTTTTTVMYIGTVALSSGCTLSVNLGQGRLWRSYWLRYCFRSQVSLSLSLYLSRSPLTLYLALCLFQLHRRTIRTTHARHATA